MIKIGIDAFGDNVSISKECINKHLFAVGKSGTGKTTFMVGQILERVAAGEKVIAFNFRNNLNRKFMHKKHRDLYENHVFVIDAKEEGIKLPLFGSDEKNETSYEVGARVSKMLAKCVGLSPTQEDIVYRATEDMHAKNMFREYGIKGLDDWLAVQKKAVARNAAAKLRGITSINLFREGDIFEIDSDIIEVDLNSLEYDLQIMAVSFVLEYVVRAANKGVFRGKPITLFIDEAQNLDFGPDSPIRILLNESRRANISVLLAFPELISKHGVDVGLVQQCATQVFFTPLEKEIRKIAELIDAQKADSVVHTLSRLPRGKFIAKGELCIDGKSRDKYKLLTYQI